MADKVCCQWCGSDRVRITTRLVITGYRREGRRHIPIEGPAQGRHCASCGGWQELTPLRAEARA